MNLPSDQFHDGVGHEKHNSGESQPEDKQESHEKIEKKKDVAAKELKLPRDQFHDELGHENYSRNESNKFYQEWVPEGYSMKKFSMPNL